MSDPRPERLQIETFLGCNARCSMCSVKDWAREHGEMSDKVFHAAIEQGTDFNDSLHATSLTMDGEPLMGRHIAKRVSYSKKAGLRAVGFATNGSLLDDVKAAELLDAGIDWISFSFDSLDKEIYEAARGRLSFSRTLENITNFVARRNAGNYETKVNIRHLDHRGNPADFAAYEAFWKPQLRSRDQVHYARVYNWYNDSAADPTVPLSCAYPLTSLVVLRDGTVPLCCHDFNATVPFGNIMTTSLTDLWNGPEWVRVRDLHRRSLGGQIDFCVGCEMPEYEDDRKMLDASGSK